MFESINQESPHKQVVSRRALLGAAALATASLSAISGCGEIYEKAEASEVGASVFAKISGGSPGGHVVGAELIITVLGHYVLEVFNTSGISDKRNHSLQKSEFDVTTVPHREILPDWEPATSVLLHIAILDRQGRLKTQALGLPEVLTVLS